MDEKQLMEQIEEKSKRVRRRTSCVNSRWEDFYFSDFAPRKLNNLIAPMQAGITHPDPEYYCYPAKEDEVAPRLLVLEYVVKGKGYIEYKGKTYSVRAGDSYIINRICGHRRYADPDDPYEKKMGQHRWALFGFVGNGVSDDRWGICGVCQHRSAD